MTKKSITLYIVQNAQFDEAGGNLVPFARAFTSLEKAAKFIVSDYNAFCKSFDDNSKSYKTIDKYSKMSYICNSIVQEIGK